MIHPGDVVNDYSFTFNGSTLSYFLLADTREDGYQNIVIQNFLLILHFGFLPHHTYIS